MTGFEKFQQKVKDGILRYMPVEYRDASVDIVHVNKNNGQELVGMVITKEGQTAAATVYLEEYYERFPDWISDEAVMKTIAGDYLERESKRKWAEDMAELAKDYDFIKENIRVQVVNRDMNRESLRDCPKKEIEGTDLLAVFRILFYEMGEARASALVTDAIMEKWDIDVESLYETALDNTAAQAPAQINSMMSMFYGGEEPLAPEDVFREEGLYVLSNPQKHNGAAVMLYPGFLQSIAEATQSSFYILPSSIHEVLLIKEESGMGTRELRDMVMDVNRNEVDPREVLSDQVYFYDGKEQKLSMATIPEETKELMESMEMVSAGYGGIEAESTCEEMER